MSDERQTHIWDGGNPENPCAYCGTSMCVDSVFYVNIRLAIKHIESGENMPCPDCAREIIKQLLKAIE